MKYFPDKPNDVTCATCPYQHGNRCGRNPPRRIALNTECMNTTTTDRDDTPSAGFCGEHPWFVRTRAEQDEQTRAYTNREIETQVQRVRVVE